MKPTYIWHDGIELQDIPVHQVYVFAYTGDDQAVLVRDFDESRYTLPGGKVENGETSLVAAKRELFEEAQLSGGHYVLLGSLEVKVYDATGKLLDWHQQVRFACRVEKNEQFIPRKDGFETIERRYVPFEVLKQYIEWLTTDDGGAQYAAFLSATKKN